VPKLGLVPEKRGHGAEGEECRWFLSLEEESPGNAAEGEGAGVQDFYDGRLRERGKTPALKGLRKKNSIISILKKKIVS